MPVFDITQTIRDGMPTYPGDPRVAVEQVRSLHAGDPYELRRLTLGSHTGTHVDAPRHFLAGTEGVDALPLDVLIGGCMVAPAPWPRLNAATFAGLGMQPGTRPLLLHTQAAGATASVTGDGAAWLVAWGVRLVGIDRQSVETDAPGFPAHHVLLAAGVVVVEGLDLRSVPAGKYHLACLPLKVGDGDGSPARAVLWTS